MDPSSLCSQGVTQSEAGHGNGGLNQGGSGLPLECSGIDQGRPSLGSQLQQPFVEATNQFPLQLQQQLPPRLQQLPPLLLQTVLLLLPPLLPTVQLLHHLQWLLQQLQWLLQPHELQQLLQELGLQPLQLRGESSFDDTNGAESLKVTSKCEEKLSSNPSSLVDKDFDHSDEIGSDQINPIGSQTSKVKSKRKKNCKSSVWNSYRIIGEKDGNGKERAQCIRCDKIYVVDSKTIGTSTLNRHVQNCSRNEGQLQPRGQRLEPIQEENIVEARTPERPCVPQAHISPAAQRWTRSSPASGVLGTTPAVTKKRRRLAKMHTESDKSIWSEKSAFGPTSHDSANKSDGTQADEGKSSTPPAATEEVVQAPRDLQLSLATTKSGPQEESGSVHKQFASAEELRSIAERKKALKITLNSMLNDILDSLWKDQIECLGRYESAVDVKPLEAIFTELFASLKERQSIQDPASLYQNEVLDPAAKLEREIDEVLEARETERQATDELKRLRKSIDECRQRLHNLEKNQKHQENILREASEKLKGTASIFKRREDFNRKMEDILGVELARADPEVAAQKYAAQKREELEYSAVLQYFSGKINDFFKE